MGHIMPKSKPSHIKDILGQILKGNKWEAKAKQYSLFSEWDKIVGPEIASHAKPFLWQGTILKVEVENSVWLQELRMMETDLLEKIRRSRPDCQIKAIHWKLKV